MNLGGRLMHSSKDLGVRLSAEHARACMTYLQYQVLAWAQAST